MIRLGFLFLQLKGCLGLNLMTGLRSHPLECLLIFFLEYLLRISPKPSDELGRVQVARHKLEIKTLYIYLVFITLYFSGVGALEFRRIVEKRWDEERNRTFTPSQTWLIPQPRFNSWGDSKIYKKVNLVKNIIGYKPRINTKNDERNMRIPQRQISDPESRFKQRILAYGSFALRFSNGGNRRFSRMEIPKLKDLRFYQDNRGLTFSVLEEV